MTLQDVYHCAIDKQLFAKKIEQAQTFADALGETWIVLARHDYTAHVDDVAAWVWKKHPVDPDDVITRGTPERITVLTTHDITYHIERTETEAAKEIRLRVEAVHRWYVHDWNTLDNKIRSSIVEGVSVFLSMFDLPAVARVFCPRVGRPAVRSHPRRPTRPRTRVTSPRPSRRRRSPRNSHRWISSSTKEKCSP